MNTALFKYHMAKYGDSVGSLAKFLGISASRASMKVNARADFWKNELVAIKSRYKMTLDDFNAVFFDEKVS